MLICAFRSVDKPIPILLQRVYYTCMKKKCINIIVVFVGIRTGHVRARQPCRVHHHHHHRYHQCVQFILYIIILLIYFHVII